MDKWVRLLFPKSTGLAPYVWAVLFILPFYFIFRSSSVPEVVTGILLIIAFFVSYRLSVTLLGWPVYVFTSLQIVISIVMTFMYGYIYFSFFLAFFIGNIQNRAGFFTMYTVHVVCTCIAVNLGFLNQAKWFLTQIPFLLLCLIGVILIPFNTYSRNKQGELEGQLEDANQRIAELVKQEERQRIARDLHDTLGQKLSMIGLKSDLARKLVVKQPERAQEEMKDINLTARAALKEVREMVSEMRGMKVEEELYHVERLLTSSEIEFVFSGETKLDNVSYFVENVLSMCMREAVTNVVRHSGAEICQIDIQTTVTDITIQVMDNGIGLALKQEPLKKGNGLHGMKERVEFVEGSLDLVEGSHINGVEGPGTTVIIKVPNVVRQVAGEV